MEHTPGPWYVSRDFEVLSDNDEIMDGYIADVISKNGNYTDEDEQERMANARLIAAAPDMFRILEDVLYEWGNHDSRSLREAKAIVDKIRGDSAT